MDEHDIIIDNQCPAHFSPPSSSIRHWAEQALSGRVKTACELHIAIVEKTIIQELNFNYRQRNKATNVLSFPANIAEQPALAQRLLGDIAICAEVVNREAQEQAKEAQAHWAHMIVHACLHLLGFDHETDADARQMEQLETQIITAMGFAQPYQ